MELDHHVVRRLAFIRYLFQTAMSQSRAPAPLKCASILTMHDAAELWLQLASEKLGVGASQPGFMEYWDLLEPKLAPAGLTQKESMRRLNKARVALKHHGTFPSDLDIEGFRATTVSFFHENTPVVFAVSLEDISLIEFVNPEAARTLLKDAQAAVSGGEILGALDKVALAYAEMIRDYEDRKRSRFAASPFYFGRDLTSHSAYHLGLQGGRGRSSEERKFAEFVDRVKESIEAMQGAIKVLALGIDYRKYSKFKQLTPHVVRGLSGDWGVFQGRIETDGEPDAEDVQFCVDFVIESALALTEFDYSLGDDA